ncbi:eukaryotic translation initiation factor 3 subunit E-like [Rutidosis leptorrhynchoides]|uniref:eukaryotic translation initiation factor 3 subunit E-like n=1 Tax=Rutidosis leptorrhynchoides TaxID=125765 RepID=UPI003A9A5C0F
MVRALILKSNTSTSMVGTIGGYMNFDPEQIEALYQYAKFQFKCGNNSKVVDYLYQYQSLCTNAERCLSVYWGKLAAKILMQNWDIALKELKRLKDIIVSKNITSSLNQV